jgi:hypothetical protein
MIVPLVLAASLAWTSACPPLYRATPGAIDSLLSDERWAALTIEERLLALAPLRVGTPYVLGCLGEGREPDPDPIFRLDQADCTVLVLTDAALVHARSLEDAARWMARIHYRDGKPSYATRLHFTVDRILSSPFFEDLTPDVAPRGALRSVGVRFNRRKGGEPLLAIPWSRSALVRYLPAEEVTQEVLDRLPRACGVAFLAEKNIEKGFLASHEGLLLERRTLHHASSAAGRVVNVPFLDYLRGDGPEPRFDGVLFYAFE